MKPIQRFVIYSAVIVFLLMIIFMKRHDLFSTGVDNLASRLNSPFSRPGKNHPSKAVREYCNSPQDIIRGDEGKAPPNYELLSVQLMIRHGNRLPMPEHLEFGNLVLQPISCKLNPSYSFMPAELGEYIENVHQYVKSELKQEGDEEVDESCSAADLTQIGIEQHIANGLALKEAYGESLSLTDKNLKIFSTRRQRTFMSAYAFSFGLITDLNPNSLQLEHVENTNFCFPNSMNEGCNCLRAKTAFAKGEKSLHQRLGPSDQNFIQSVESVKRSLKLPDMKAPYPWKLGHDFMVQPLCRGEMPHCSPHDKTSCLTFEQEDLNWDSLNFYFKNMFEDSKMKLSAKLDMYPLISDIGDRMLQHVALTTGSKPVSDQVVVFSGHDNSIHPLMLSLGLPVSDWPPYASRLIFELYKPVDKVLGSDGSKDFVFKLIYNGKDITELTSFCSATPCSLENFIHYQRSLISSLGYSSYKSACKDKNPLQ